MSTGVMRRRGLVAILALALCAGPVLPAWADNQMGYSLMSEQDAGSLPRGHGSLGLDVERASQINDGGMVFDIMRVRSVRPGSPAAQAGLRPGDQVIAIDGRVFPTIRAFAGYVGSVPPGQPVKIDYMPAGAGPQQAQRVTAVIAAAGQPAPPPAASAGGLTTGEKVAIGVGAAALLVCYKRGCFARHDAAAPAGSAPQ